MGSLVRKVGDFFAPKGETVKIPSLGEFIMSVKRCDKREVN